MKRFKDLKINTKWTIIVMIASFILTIGANYVVTRISTRYLTSQIKERYSKEAFDSMVVIDIIMDKYYKNIKDFAVSDVLIRGTSTPEQINAYLRRKKEGYSYESLSYFDMNRIRIADTANIGVGKQHPLTGFWHDVLKGEVSTDSDVRPGPERKISIIYFAAPVKDIKGKIIGCIVARVVPAQIAETVAQIKGGKKGIEATLFDKERNVIFSSCLKFKVLALEKKIPEFFAVKTVLANRVAKALEYLGCCREEFFTVYAPEKGYGNFKGNDWLLIISLKKDMVFAPIRQLRNAAAGIFIIMFAGIFFVGFIGSRAISEPILKLSEAARRVGKGDLTCKVEVVSHDEIGQLAVSFNEMAENLKKANDELFFSKCYTDSIISSMADALVVINPDTTIRSVNKAILDLLGYKKEELVGRQVEKIFVEEEIPFKGIGLRKLIKEGLVRDFDLTCKTNSGEKIPVSFSGSVMYESNMDLRRVKERIYADKKDIIRNTHGARRIIGIVGVARDMRNIKGLIDDLEKSKLEVEEWSKTLENKVKERVKDLSQSKEATLNILEDIQEEKEKVEKQSAELIKADKDLKLFSEGLEEKVKERTMELSILYEVSNAISYTLDYQTLLKLIIESLFKIVDYDICASLLFDARTANITLKSVYPESAEFVNEVKTSLIDSTSTLTGENISRKYLSAFLIPANPDAKPKEERKFDELRSFFNVPFIVRGKTIGMINVSSCKDNAFSEDDIKLIYTIANQASNAIERLQAVITAEKSKMESMVESMVEGVIMVDERGEVIVLNPQARRILGFRLDEEVTSKTLDEKMKTINLDKALRESQEEEHLVTKEIALPCDEGRIFRCDISPVKDLKGGIIGIVTILRDITREKEVDKMKTEFVSTVSHELRTPLTTMKEFTSILLDEIPGKLTKDQREYTDIIKSNIDRLARLINNLLDISKIEAGKIELKKAFVDVTSLANRVVSTLKPEAEAKHIEFKTLFPASKIDIYSDPDKIIQIFTNLIGNAIKFTLEKGQITVAIIDKDKEIECSVADTGVGIAPENLAKLFNKFQQFIRVPCVGAKGTGLGLAISKELIQMHNGRIWAESKLGKGTKLIFTLPKLTAESLFKEYVDNGIKQAMKNDSNMSLIVVSLADPVKLRRKLTSEMVDFILKDMEGVLKNSRCREEGDIVIKSTNEVGVILSVCGKENALRVEGRFEHILEGYLARKKVTEKIELRFGCAAYPDDARSAEELIKKAKKV